MSSNGAAPAPPARLAPARPSTAGPYLRARLRSLDARLRELSPRVLSSAGDPEAVHDFRVALRRARSVLEIGSAVFGPFHAEEVRASLRDLQRATGTLRDEEVLVELVGSLGVRHPGVAAWLESRRRHERRLRRALARAIEAGALDQGRRLLDAMLAFRVDPSRDRRLVKFARRAVLRARRRVERRRMAARADDTIALHDLRIAYKRLRYAVETFSAVLSSDLAGLAQPASRLQSRLGEVHDVDVAVVSVRRARSLSDEARRELLAALLQRRQERMAAYEREAAALVQPPVEQALQASGGVALRKISTR